jgi:phosphoesterase RecJ-like protein
VFEKIFATAPLRRLELLREALANLHQDAGRGIAWITIPKELTDRLGSTPDDYEGLIEHVRSIEGTRVAILFREAGPAETKVSLRSSGATDVNEVARAFGGGGHVKASGATVGLPLAEAVERVVRRVAAAVDAMNQTPNP